MSEFITHWHDMFFDPDRIPFAIAAILVTIVVGMVSGPFIGSGNANPFIWIALDKIFGGVGDRLNKTHRQRADLLFRGFIFTIVIVLLMFIAGKGIDIFIATRNAQSLFEVLALCLCISSGAVWFSLLRLYFAMEKDEVGSGAYYAISRSTRSNLSNSDDFTITRCAMNYSARSFDKSVVAPIFWYLVAGLVGVFLYTALSFLTWRFGRQGFTKGFGESANALEKLLGFVPNALSGLLITFAGLFTPTAKWHKGLLAFFGHKNRAGYAIGGAPLSALAWSLGLSLGGASQSIDGTAIKAPWVGPQGATAKNDHKHLRRAIYINVIAHVLWIVLLLCMYLWAGVLGGGELKHIKIS
ncbi:MAG: cobalamin biosynthesis protein [Alphaproteobacteria bacterium]